MSTVRKDFGRYTYEDESIGLTIVVKQLYARHYEASAHVLITAKASDGEDVKLFESRSPITTGTARKRIASDVDEYIMGDEKKGDQGLKGRFGINSPVVTNDWKSSISGAMEQILQKHYAGTPPENLYDYDLDDEEDQRIMGFLSEDINMIYGQSGSGKSYCGIIAGQAIQHGVPFAGLGTIQGNVLLVDYETTRAKMRKRFKRVDAGLKVEGNPMYYMPASVPLAQMVEPLQTYIVERDIDFLVIDSLARASGGSITDEDGVNMMFEAIRSLERPCLIIHHTNRGDDYFGSTYIRANARNIWRLRSAQAEGEGKLSMTLEQEKENDGASRGVLGFVMEFKGDPFDPDEVVLIPEDVSKMPTMRDRLRLWQRLEGYLRETPQHRMLIDDPNPDSTFTMAGGNIVRELGLDKSQQNTLRNYIWALKNNTGSYKALAKAMHVKDGWLRLNDEIGYQDELPDWADKGEYQNNINDLRAEGINISELKDEGGIVW